MTHSDFMHQAIQLSRESIEKGGGPFGAVIVKNGEIISKNHNRVTLNNDPTAHAEINAIRDACQNLNNWDLSGCTIYTSCEPCPMCLSAIYWAKIDTIYYANTHKDAEAIGFSDAFIYDQFVKAKQDRAIPIRRMDANEAISVFNDWKNKADKTTY